MKFEEPAARDLETLHISLELEDLAHRLYRLYGKTSRGLKNKSIRQVASQINVGAQCLKGYTWKAKAWLGRSAWLPLRRAQKHFPNATTVQITRTLDEGQTPLARLVVLDGVDVLLDVTNTTEKEIWATLERGAE